MSESKKKQYSPLVQKYQRIIFLSTNDQEIKIKVTGEDAASPTIKAAVDKLTQSIGVLTQSQLASGAAAKQSEKDHEELKVGLINLTAAFTLIQQAGELAAHVFHTIEAQLERAVEEALEFEKANNRLTGALVATGQYTASAADELGKYAESVEHATGVNGELVKNMIATGVQMGLSVEQSKQMEEAARKLAAATGKDVNEAFSMLQRSLTGQSRSLAQVLPQIKEFGEAQLKQGVAIDVVNKQLDAQYKLYQQSLPAGIDRAKASVDNVYKAFGLMITQSDLAKRAVDFFTYSMESLEQGIKTVDHWLTQNKQNIVDFGEAFGKAALVVGASVVGYSLVTAAVGLMAGGFSLAAVAGGALTAVMAVLASPITLTVIAVGALTAALYKWPGLFDVIVGSLKVVGSTLLMLASGPMLIAIEAAGKLAGLFDKELGDSITSFSQKIYDQQQAWVTAGAAQVEYGLQSVTSGKQVEDASNKSTDAVKQEMAALSARNAVEAKRGKMYADFNIGTEKQREALRGQVQDRDKDLKDFTDYLEAKKRLALTKQEEQQMELAKVQSKVLEGGTGSQSKEAKSNVAVDAETKKQAELDALYQKGILSREQYNQATLESDQRAAQAGLDFDLANQQARADLLGESEEGYALKQSIVEQRFQLELQQKIERAQIEDATDQEIQALRDDAEAQHRELQLASLDAHLNAIAAREEISGSTIVATQQKWFREQEKAQSTRIKNLASGVTLMEGIQEGYNKSTQALGDALVKNEKITAGKFVGIFLESLGRKIQMDGFANLLMGAALSVMLNPQGPALLAAGGAEVAGGTAIARAGVSMQGGQADEGMDSIPGSLAGKSFILSQGERIVQPSANKNLSKAVEKINNGDGSGGGNYNITLNYNGSGSRDDASKMADMVMEEIRARSERGVPVMNEKGLVKT